MPNEKIGDSISVVTADHPPRTDSPEYGRTRKWLMGETAAGCYVCEGPVDLSHPSKPGDPKGLQDHHGGALMLYPADGSAPVLVGTNLFGLEWSLGWGADPSRVAAFVAQVNEVTKRLGGPAYDAEIASTADVMSWVDGHGNAAVKLCSVHHLAHETQHTPDARGFEGVGLHVAPYPIWLGQATCDFVHWDMFGGTTGTVVVGHPGDDSGTAHVLHVSPLHPDKALYDQHQADLKAGTATVLPAHHPHARLAHAGAHQEPAPA
jgi:hypothetical protein